jgi:hypothetical protein
MNTGTALFSFEGVDLEALVSIQCRQARMRTITPLRESPPLIFENCIEKNFHVPNMKSGPCEEHGCNFDPKIKKKNTF